MEEVVVLAGGQGMRLRPYTTVLPKPLLPVGDMPVLEILLRRLAVAGLRRVHLAVGHLAELIEAYFGDGGRFGVELRYWREDEPLGTVGPLARMDLASPRVLVLNGDLFTSIDFREVLDSHAANKAAITLAVLRREVPIDFGVVHAEGDVVVSFEEKPKLTYDVSMGVYVFERAALELVPQEGRFDFPDLVHAALDAGLAVHAHRSDAFWLDIGRPEDYELAVETYDEIQPKLFPGT